MFSLDRAGTVGNPTFEYQPQKHGVSEGTK